jgi:hypothetical protein
MTDQPQPSQSPLEIRKPCPKTWGELTGDGAQRFCSACDLHVHDAARLTRAEALALAAGTRGRVCMRIEYDASGAPRFRDSAPAPVAAHARRQPALRLVRWALSAAAGVLAACHGSTSTPSTSDPATGAEGPPSRMGEVSTTELLGDVALPPARPPEILGEVALPDPTPPPAPEDVSAPDDEARTR